MLGVDARLSTSLRAGNASRGIATGAFGTVPGVLLPYLTDTLRIVPAATAVIVFAPKAWAGRADRLRRNRPARGMAPVNAPLELAPPALREQPWWPSSTSSPDPLDNRLQPRRAPSSLTCIGEAAMRPHKTGEEVLTVTSTITSTAQIGGPADADRVGSTSGLCA